MTETEKPKAGLPYRYDDPELVAMKGVASPRQGATFGDTFERLTMLKAFRRGMICA